jgi:hypothetical protein
MASGSFQATSSQAVATASDSNVVSDATTTTTNRFSPKQIGGRLEMKIHRS